MFADEFKDEFEVYAEPEDARNGAGRVLFEVKNYKEFNDEYNLLSEDDKKRFKKMLFDLNLIKSPEHEVEEKQWNTQTKTSNVIVIID